MNEEKNLIFRRTVAKILLVDDEKNIRKTLKRRLESWGFDVVAVQRGQEAIDKTRVSSTDAIILDIKMPKMDGIETLRQIRSFNKEIPVIMLTAYPSESNICQARELGIDGFVPKGEEFSQAMDMLYTVLRIHKRLKRDEGGENVKEEDFDR